MPSLDSVLKTWRELDGKFRFIVDNYGAILVGEEGFFAADIAGADFNRIGRRMRPADWRFAGRFDDLLRCTASATALIPKATDDGHWVLRAGPLRADPAPDRVGLNTHEIALTIHGTGTGGPAHWADFRDAFNLTNAEDRVLQLMIGGNSAAAVAKQEAVSINTVRTHVRHIHEKLAVSDAYELWLRISDYRLL